MTVEIGLIVGSLLILFCTAVGVAVISIAFYSFFAGRIARLAPSTRANFLFAWSTAPVWLSITLLLLVLSPSIAHALGFGIDHCHDHLHHIHLCVIHTPWLVGGMVEWTILASLVVLGLAWLTAAATRVNMTRDMLEMLYSLSRPKDDSQSVRVVLSQRHFVFTAGILRPRIFLSSRLLESISPSELETVIAHEHAHQRRWDGMRLFVADILCGLHYSPVRRRLLADLHLAVEQACDEVAAGQSGDRLQVAETILRLTRLIGSSAPCMTSVKAAFTGSDTAQRVEGLLRPPIPWRPAVSVWVSLLAAGLLMLGLASNDWWHHSTESLLDHFLD
ncbi:MAG: M56 family metallopeptidase [Candidatus Thiodiazotropha endolucinida]